MNCSTSNHRPVGTPSLDEMAGDSWEIINCCRFKPLSFLGVVCYLKTADVKSFFYLSGLCRCRKACSRWAWVFSANSSFLPQSLFAYWFVKGLYIIKDIKSYSWGYKCSLYLFVFSFVYAASLVYRSHQYEFTISIVCLVVSCPHFPFWQFCYADILLLSDNILSKNMPKHLKNSSYIYIYILNLESQILQSQMTSQTASLESTLLQSRLSAVTWETAFLRLAHQIFWNWAVRDSWTLLAFLPHIYRKWKAMFLDLYPLIIFWLKSRTGLITVDSAVSLR